MALRDEWMKKHFCSWNRNFFPKFDFVSVTRKRKNIKNYSRHLCRRKTETLIDFPNSLSFYHFLFVMQTRNTQQPSSLRSIYQRNSFQIRFPQKANASVKRRVRKRAIDINLISKLLFKSKQMYFIVKNYWQYVLRARAARCKWKKHDNARDNNESLLSHAHVAWTLHPASQLISSSLRLGGLNVCKHHRRHFLSARDRVNDDDTNRKLRHSSFA